MKVCLSICCVLQLYFLVNVTIGQGASGIIPDAQTSTTESVDDAGIALSVARERLGKIVPNGDKLYRAIRVVYEDGHWKCFLIPRDVTDAEWKKMKMYPADYLITVDPNTRLTKVNGVD